MKHISLLLGAGFSVNKGYPTANQLNARITSLKAEKFAVAPQGSFCRLETGQEDPYTYSEYYVYKLFSLELIAFFAAKGPFNYEEFFDYYSNVLNGEIADEEFDLLCQQFREKHRLEINNGELISQHDKIFNQMIASFLVDRDGNRYYPNIHQMGGYPGYNGFLGCLGKWGAEDRLAHIHTLNHDLFMESLEHTDAVSGGLSDGFEELGSPFYGEMQDGNKVRLSYFTGRYDAVYRLYKLHGSLNYYPFHKMNGGRIDAYIKTKYGIGNTDYYKEETGEDGKLHYVNDFINFFPDFLSGTTSKILRYGDPVYYEKVFELFVENLRRSDALVIIGYGCGDVEINRMIRQHFKGRIFVVDPFPSEAVHQFCALMAAKLILKTPEGMGLGDFT